MLANGKYSCVNIMCMNDAYMYIFHACNYLPGFKTLLYLTSQGNICLNNKTNFIILMISKQVTHLRILNHKPLPLIEASTWHCLVRAP